MGNSPSKRTPLKQQVSSSHENNLEASNEIYNESMCSKEDDFHSDESFVFIDPESKEWSVSVSSAEEAVLIVGSKQNDICTQPEAISCTKENFEGNAQHQEIVKKGYTASCSITQEPNNQGREPDDVQENELRKECDLVDITPISCSGESESSRNQNHDLKIHKESIGIDQSNTVCPDELIPLDVSLTGKDQWVQIKGCNSSLFEIYDIFSAYGSISALAQAEDLVYVKFSSWAGIKNVFEDFRNLKQIYQFNVIAKVEGDDLKTYPERKEIYLDLPSFVIMYLKDHNELTKALNMVTMSANDNICLNAPKVQQVLDLIRINVIKRFQHCRLFPFGCHVLGSCDISDALEIFVDVGGMYAGCHKQSQEDQINISKEIRKLISDNVVWYSHEESPIGIFFHKTVGLKCILNFNNGFGDRITRLLSTFMDYDDRFRVLYLMLDMWSKQCYLQGVSNGLNSYIVAVLLVFYLQVLPAPLLPALQRIRTGRPIVIKGWDCTFTEDANILPRNECAMELRCLLRGFFVFYGSYDWNRVVCPVLGQSIDRNLFSSPSAPLPEDPIVANYLRSVSENVPNTSRLDITTCMCVQDFFNLSENITKGVSEDTLLRFQSLCRQSHKMIYSAESRMLMGPHVLHRQSNSPPVPYQLTTQGRDLLAHGPTNRFKVGSLSDDMTSSSRSCSRSSNSDYPSEEGCAFWTANGIDDARQNNLQQSRFKNRKRAPHHRNYDHIDEDTMMNRQSGGNYNTRYKNIQEANSTSRSYKARVFWHHNAKNKLNYH